jgi:hypothetical protein
MRSLRVLAVGLILLSGSAWIRRPASTAHAGADLVRVSAERPSTGSARPAPVQAAPSREAARSSPSAAAAPSTALVWRVARHLRRAYELICAEDCDKAVDLCEELLLVDPGYAFAAELRNLARRMAHAKINRRGLVLWLELWESATDSASSDPLIPEGARFRGEDTSILLLDTSPHVRKPKGLSGDMPHEDYLYEAGLYRKLEDERLDLDLPWATVLDVVNALRDRMDLFVHYQERPDWAKRASIRVRGLALGEGLDAALEPFGLRVVVRYDALVAVER